MQVSELQRLLGVDDNRLILYGYTFDRNTLRVWIEEEKIIRMEEEYGGEIVRWEESETVVPDMFFNNVKRWYSFGVHPRLKELVSAFHPDGLCIIERESLNYDDLFYCDKPEHL